MTEEGNAKMSAFENPHVTWRRSSLCDAGGCVEVAVANDTSADGEEEGDVVFLMRNSNDPAGQVLEFTSEEWAGFIAHIKETSAL